MAVQIDVPTAAFAEYAHRPQTMSDHAREVASALGLRAPTNSDLPDVIEAAAQAASTTDRGLPIVAGIIAALRSEKIILPAPMVIERAAIAGRARARKRAADALLAGLTDAQLATLDNLPVIDGETGLAPAESQAIVDFSSGRSQAEQANRYRNIRPIRPPSSPDFLPFSLAWLLVSLDGRKSRKLQKIAPNALKSLVR
jgi:uncharacterized protein DUF4158